MLDEVEEWELIMVSPTLPYATMPNTITRIFVAGLRVDDLFHSLREPRIVIP